MNGRWSWIGTYRCFVFVRRFICISSNRDCHWYPHSHCIPRQVQQRWQMSSSHGTTQQQALDSFFVSCHFSLFLLPPFFIWAPFVQSLKLKKKSNIYKLSTKAKLSTTDVSEFARDAKSLKEESRKNSAFSHIYIGYVDLTILWKMINFFPIRMIDPNLASSYLANNTKGIIANQTLCFRPSSVSCDLLPFPWLTSPVDPTSPQSFKEPHAITSIT